MQFRLAKMNAVKNPLLLPRSSFLAFFRPLHLAKKQGVLRPA